MARSIARFDSHRRPDMFITRVSSRHRFELSCLGVWIAGDRRSSALRGVSVRSSSPIEWAASSGAGRETHAATEYSAHGG